MKIDINTPVKITSVNWNAGFLTEEMSKEYIGKTGTVIGHFYGDMNLVEIVTERGNVRLGFSYDELVILDSNGNDVPKYRAEDIDPATLRYVLAAAKKYEELNAAWLKVQRGISKEDYLNISKAVFSKPTL